MSDPVGPIAADAPPLVGTKAVREFIRIARARRLTESEVEWAMCRLGIIDIVADFAYQEIKSLRSEAEIAWAAGFYDGEGSTGVTTRTSGRFRYSYLQVSISQKDRRPLERFVTAVGPANVRGPYSGKQKLGGPTYQVTYTGRRAETVIALLWPYLSEPKREQIEEKRKETGRYAVASVD